MTDLEGSAVPDGAAASSPKASRAPIVLAVVALAVAGLALVLAAASPRGDAQATKAEAGAGASAGVGATSGEADLFTAPADVKALIDEVQRSTVIVECGGWQGSGWVLDLPPLDPADADPEWVELDRKFPVEVITNHHVIEDCVEAPEDVTVVKDGETYAAYLYSWDEDNDLAMVATAQEFPALVESDEPQPGWWAMAVGTPDGLEGSVSLGNVMNTDGTDVISTTPLNSGNSGGPLVNSRGEVIGTNTWFMVSTEDEAWQDWNVAVGVPKLCEVLVACEDGDLSWK